MDVECLNVQGHGEGRSDLGLQTRSAVPGLLRLCWTFSIYSVVPPSATALLFSNGLSFLTSFPWLVCSFPLHRVYSDCPVKPAITLYSNPVGQPSPGYVCLFYYFRLFTVQTFRSSCTTLQKGQSHRAQQNSLFNMLCRTPMEDPTK